MPKYFLVYHRYSLVVRMQKLKSVIKYEYNKLSFLETLFRRTQFGFKADGDVYVSICLQAHPEEFYY